MKKYLINLFIMIHIGFLIGLGFIAIIDTVDFNILWKVYVSVISLVSVVVIVVFAWAYIEENI